MPRYDYECEKCGNVQEEVHGMKESPKVKCVKCGSKKTHKTLCSTHQVNMNEHPGWDPDECN